MISDYQTLFHDRRMVSSSRLIFWLDVAEQIGAFKSKRLNPNVREVNGLDNQALASASAHASTSTSTRKK